jgi:DUF1365 family protein
MALNNGLLVTDVSHTRVRPKRNHFLYRVYYLCFALEDEAELENALLSREKWNVFSFFRKDYGDRKTAPLAWVRGLLAQYEMTQADGKVVLLTLPRVLGYVFNPISLYFCLDAQGQVRAVVSEVTNTFKDRHSYISFHDDHRPITQDDMLEARKMMHVSPYCEVKGHYVFRFAYREDKIGVWIDYHDEDGVLIHTALTGKRQELSALSLAGCFVRYPFITLKVIVLIHYQALKLWLKGIRYRTRPQPPLTESSR